VKERADLGDAFQSTYIDDLNVQLDGLLDDQADKTIATLTFTGTETCALTKAKPAKAGVWSGAQGETNLLIAACARTKLLLRYQKPGLPSFLHLHQRPSALPHARTAVHSGINNPAATHREQ
jgi:hypothetical protein